MPPKTNSANKKKLSKAEKEKLKQEEEERKLQEEEEARIKFEEEEKKRKAKEKEEETERRKLENAEKENRRKEMLVLVELQEANRNALDALHDERRKEAKWARYMRCDGSPNPTIPGEINTYINLRLEDSKHNDIDSVLKHSEQDLSLIEELQFLIDDTPGSEVSPEDEDRYKSKVVNLRQVEETMEDLQRLMQVKLDAATVLILQQATDLCDSETFNLQYMKQNQTICLCIWGNLSKNPRIKSFEFTEKGFQFDIPRILTLSDCAFRVLFTKYDHFSPKCKSFYPRKKRKEEPVPEVKEEDMQEKEAGEESQEEKKEEDETAEGEEGMDKENTEDLMAMLRNPGGVEEEKKEEEVEEKVEEVEEFEDPELPEPIEWEDFDEDDDVADLRANHVIGGVFHFNLMQLPPQPKTVNNWVITRLVDPPEIELMDYIADTVNPALNKEGQSPSQEKADTKRDERPPIGVAIRLADDVMFTEEPQIARWDYTNNHWRMDGFTDFNYDEDKRVFHFKTAYFGTMALLQDAHINMPFQSWELRPHKQDSALLTIIAAIIEIEIEIKGPMCCLSKPDDKPELEAIRNKWMTPNDLVITMRRAGVNVFPAEDSSKYVSIQNKHAVIESWCYEQMAMCASSFAFSWSKWNGDTQDSEKVLFQASEALEDEPLLEEDWAMFMMTKRRAMKLKMDEFSEAFSDDMAEGVPFKSNLYHLLLHCATEPAKERIKNSSNEFISAVQQILSATKLLTYA